MAGNQKTRITQNTPTPELNEDTSASRQPAVRRSASDRVSYEEKATLSDTARVASLEQRVRQLPEIRQTRVLALSRAIRQGQYCVHSDQIANAMLSEMMSSGRRRSAESTGELTSLEHAKDIIPEQQ